MADALLDLLNGGAQGAAASAFPSSAPASSSSGDPLLAIIGGSPQSSSTFSTQQSTQQAQQRPPLPGIFSRAGMQQMGSNALNMVLGAVKGASDIGSTLVAPGDMLWDAINGKGLSLESNRARRDAVTNELSLLGADPSSLQFEAGKLGAGIAGTAGTGPALATPVSAAAPTISRALASGGFDLGGASMSIPAQIATRMGAGATVGAATAGLINPEDAIKGSVIGGLSPVAAQGIGKTAQGIGNLIRTPQEARVAQQLGRTLGISADDLRGAITGPQMIPGYQLTVPQIVQDPAASQLQRTLQSSGQQAIADVNAAQQAQFRDAIDRIAPLGTTVQDAAARAGGAIQNYAIPAKMAAGQKVNALFEAIPRDSRIELPLQAMQDAQTKFLGPGTFGGGGAPVEQAMNTANSIGMDASTLTPKAVPFEQIQALRSSLGEAISQSRASGNNQAAAALTQMKNAIDSKVADVAAGNAAPGEVFTPQAVDAWGQALNAHAAKMQQFGTGPQVGMFRLGADGQPVTQGAEIPGKFFNGNRSQVEDVQAFKRLVGDRNDLAQELKSYALTEGINTQSAQGNLSDRFIRWMTSRSGATGQLFTPTEQATIQEVGKAVQRQIAAENLGRVSGPDTAQKLASLQNNGLLDNSFVSALARKTPLIGHFTGPALDALRQSATQARGGIQAGLLADPQRFAGLLSARPGLMQFDPAPLGLLTRGAYPALSSQ